MFWHNFKCSLKVLVRNKSLIFWTILFPILMATFFNMAFSDIEKKEKLDIIDIAIINNDYFINDKIYNEVFLELGNKKSKNQLFNIEYTDLTQAKELLEDEKIVGYIEFLDDDTVINVNNDGINETILRFVVDSVNSDKVILEDLVNKKVSELDYKNYINYEKIYSDALALINKQDVKLNDISNKNLGYTNIEYYTLIAMSCLYGAILSMYVTNTKLANMNGVGKRTSISPLSKTKIILGSLCASYVVQLVGLMLLFLYTNYFLNVSYGDRFIYILLLGMIGSLSGLALGIFVATMFKVNENTKIGVLSAIILFWCFLSGMMGITMKYVVDSNIPILNMINPCAMITDGLYSLYYYEGLERYWFNIISLIIFFVVIISISIRGLWRQKYDSI